MVDLNKFVKELGQIPTADIGDSQESKGIMSPEIKPLHGEMRFSGIAVTVQCGANDNMAINKAMAMAGPGSVLVITCEEESNCAIFGDLFATECMARGIQAAVIDGYCRDKKTIIDMGFTVFSRGINLRKPNVENKGITNKPVCCGGVMVEPGDIIIGDADGVIVVKQNEAEETLRKAELHQKKMDGLRIKCEQGITTVEAMDLFDKLDMTPEDILTI